MIRRYGGDSFVMSAIQGGPSKQKAVEIKKYQYYPGGVWRDAEGGRTFDDLEPYSGKVYAKIAAGLADEIFENTNVKVINLIGGVKTAKYLLERAAKTLKRTVFELGGYNPMIILDDVDEAVKAATFGALRFIGVFNNLDVPKFASGGISNGTLEELKTAVTNSLGVYGTYTVDENGDFLAQHILGSTDHHTRYE